MFTDAGVDWAGLDEDQVLQVKLGLDAGVDVGVYACREYDWFKMSIIRDCLVYGVCPVLAGRVFSPGFSVAQLRELSAGLKQGVNVGVFADPGLDYRVMRQVRLGLLDGEDLSSLARQGAGELELISVRLAGLAA